MSNIQKEMLKHNGRVNLSKMINIPMSEFQYFKMTMLSINHKKYPLKKLMLNDCELTDGNFSALVPLICQFKWVTLNGSQKIGISGWTKFKEYVIKYGCKIEKLELKIVETKAGALQLRKKMEDLEEIVTDQAGWEINDNDMETLAPALARIKEVHLGQNAMTATGWAFLKTAIAEQEKSIRKKKMLGTENKLAILNLSLMSRQNVKGEIKYIQPSHMRELSNVLIQMEEVNLAGQISIGGPRKESNPEKSTEKSETGWEIFEKIIKETDSENLRLKSINVRNCGMDTDAIVELQQALSKKNKKVELIIDKKGRNYAVQTSSCCLCCK